MITEFHFTTIFRILMDKRAIASIESTASKRLKYYSATYENDIHFKRLITISL